MTKEVFFRLHFYSIPLRPWIGVLFASALACSDSPTKVPTSAQLSSSADTANLIVGEPSENGFYLGSDGYYHWNGVPPAGDLLHATIKGAVAAGIPPGGVDVPAAIGVVVYEGDQSNIDLSVTVRDSVRHTNVLYNAPFSSDWQWAAPPRFSQSTSTTVYQKTLSIPDDCGYALFVGGGAKVRKAVPFGFSATLVKLFGGPSVSVSPGTTSWGPDAKGLTAYQGSGPACDYPAPDGPCDDPRTPISVEDCPDTGGPSGSETPIYSANYNGPLPSGTNAVQGAIKCMEWTTYYVSYNGGRTWYYDYWECNEWAFV